MVSYHEGVEKGYRGGARGSNTLNHSKYRSSCFVIDCDFPIVVSKTNESIYFFPHEKRDPLTKYKTLTQESRIRHCKLQKS